MSRAAVSAINNLWKFQKRFVIDDLVFDYYAEKRNVTDLCHTPIFHQSHEKSTTTKQCRFRNLLLTLEELEALEKIPTSNSLPTKFGNVAKNLSKLVLQAAKRIVGFRRKLYRGSRHRFRYLQNPNVRLFLQTIPSHCDFCEK